MIPSLHHDLLFILQRFLLTDLIDVVKDQMVDYVKEEDPCIYVSRKTGRGPLSDTWIQDYWKECKVTPTPLQ